MRARSGVALAAAAAALTIGGCVTVPGGPSVAALPGQYKPFEQFRLDDADCRQWASSQVSGNTQAANDAAAGSAVLSSALGAASGAIIGSATGQAGPAAAVGAGIGLLFGSVAGANQAYASTYGLQQRYDGAYSQCMYAKGNQIPVRSPARVGYNYPNPNYPQYPGYPGYSTSPPPPVAGVPAQ
jgi:hypothetical protein